MLGVVDSEDLTFFGTRPTVDHRGGGWGQNSTPKRTDQWNRPEELVENHSSETLLQGPFNKSSLGSNISGHTKALDDPCEQVQHVNQRFFSLYLVKLLMSCIICHMYLLLKFIAHPRFVEPSTLQTNRSGEAVPIPSLELLKDLPVHRSASKDVSHRTTN